MKRAASFDFINKKFYTRIPCTILIKSTLISAKEMSDVIRREQSFTERVEIFFQGIQSCSRIDLKTISLHFYKIFKDELVSPPALRFSLEKFMELIYSSNYEDQDFISKILHAKITIDWYYRNLSESRKEIRARHIYDIIESLVLNSFEKYTDDRVKLSSLTNNFLFHGRLQMLHFFVKYNFDEFPPRTRYKSNLVISFFLSTANECILDNSINEEDIHSLLEGEGGDTVVNEGRRVHTRLMLVLWTTTVAMHLTLAKRSIMTRKKYEKKYGKEILALTAARVECLNLIMDTLPEHFLSVRNIEDIFISNFNIPKENLRLKEICDAFREAFPLCDELYNPRSLKDLCRCTIRNSMLRNASLPKQLSRLGIPSVLKDFILFNNKEIKFIT